MMKRKSNITNSIISNIKTKVIKPINEVKLHDHDEIK